MQLQWPYPEPRLGAYGVSTSKHNFCEEDHNLSLYVAEFVNTFTNLIYVIYGTHGLRRVQPRKDGGLFSSLAFPYWGLISVGVLSAWFHATLKYHSQMGDDLSMFVATGALLHQLLTFEAPPSQHLRITLLILGTLIPVSVYHCVANEIIVHEIAFAVMVYMIGQRIRRLIRERLKSKKAKAKLGNLATFGTVAAAFGYFLWSIDFHLCSYVTRLKRTVGLPWGILFELHGWWHIFTGIGAYVGMALVEYLVTADLKAPDVNDTKVDRRIEEGFVWPVRAVLRDLDGTERDGKKQS